jgi:hypothetical protein
LTTPPIIAETYQPVGDNNMPPTNPPNHKTTIRTTATHKPNGTPPKTNNRAGNATRTNKINGAVMLYQHCGLLIVIAILNGSNMLLHKH